MRKTIPNKQVIFLLVIFVFAGCMGLGSLAPDKYIHWVEDETNGLRVTKKLSNVEFRLQYKPLEYIIALEEKKMKIKDEVLKERKKEIDGMEYYALRIAAADKKTDVLLLNTNSPDDYYIRTTFYSFDFQNDISLVLGNDTIACGLFQYVNNYGIAPYVDFEIGFEKEANNQIVSDRIILIQDDIFGNGLIRFDIAKANIDKVPKLRTQ